MSKSTVYIKSDNGLITSIHYNGDLYAGKKSVDGVTIDSSDMQNIELTADCGTDNQTEVANRWNNDLDNNVIHMTSYNFLLNNASLPGKLKFMFSVAMEIAGYSYTIYLGQGQDGLVHNNWWIGSNNMNTTNHITIGGHSVFSGSVLVNPNNTKQAIAEVAVPSSNDITINTPS